MTSGLNVTVFKQDIICATGSYSSRIVRRESQRFVPLKPLPSATYGRRWLGESVQAFLVS